MFLNKLFTMQLLQIVFDNGSFACFCLSFNCFNQSSKLLNSKQRNCQLLSIVYTELDLHFFLQIFVVNCGYIVLKLLIDPDCNRKYLFILFHLNFFTILVAYCRLEIFKAGFELPLRNWSNNYGKNSISDRNKKYCIYWIKIAGLKILE